MKINKNELKNYLGALVFILLFLAFYGLVDVSARRILLYFLIPAGLFVAFNAPFALIIVNLTGLFLLFFNSQGVYWWIDTWVLLVMFMALGVLPFYYKKLFTREDKSFSAQKDFLLQKLEEKRLILAKTEEESKYLQNEVEKLTRLYLLGREFVEQMDMKEIIDHLKLSVFSRPDIKSVSIFAIDKQNLTPIYLSNPDEMNDWNAFVAANRKTASSETSPRMLLPTFSDKTVVLWPIRVEEGITVAIFFAVVSTFSATCIEEGKIFIPQIALGFKRIRLFEEVMEKSRKDGLTSLYLRRYFMERLEGEIHRAKRYSLSFSILMIDIDHFKSINDIYGHLIGDGTLKALANILTESLRPGDLIGRYGGEEFIVLLPVTSLEEANKTAHRLKTVIAQKDFLGNYRHFNITVSIGISHYPNDGNTAQKLIDSSDKALYWVKTHGRNGVKDFKAVH